MSDDARVTKLLLDYGAELSQSPGVLQHAITERMDPIMVKYLLQNGADANNMLEAGRYPLHCAAHPSYAAHPAVLTETANRLWIIRQRAVMETLLEYGANPLKLYDNGRHILQACIEEHGITSPLLKAKELDIEFNGNGGRTALISAWDEAGYKPLHLSIRSGQSDVVQYLIEKGADHNEPDPDGNTFLHHYARRIIGKKVAAAEAMGVFKSLLKMGLNINARNHRGETPLHIFMSAGWKSEDIWKDEVTWKGQVSSKHICDIEDLVNHDNDEIWDMFKAFGADWKTVDNEGSGLLHAVAARKIDSPWSQWESNQRKNSANTFKKLMEEIGLDPRLEDAQSRTPIDIAVARGNSDIIGLFSDKRKDAGEHTSGRKRLMKKSRTFL
ncbi:ankyrin repeat-containing domain protein [Nemania serpens]|nr:ankyrin repeat-containing domain protein [Nemania serpens]